MAEPEDGTGQTNVAEGATSAAPGIDATAVPVNQGAEGAPGHPQPPQVSVSAGGDASPSPGPDGPVHADTTQGTSTGTDATMSSASSGGRAALASAPPPSPPPPRSRPPSGAPVPVPEVLDGRYRVKNRLGEGATGAVYEVEHLELNRRMALKVLHEEIASQTQFEARFQREARTAAQLDHPNIVRVTDFGRTTEGHPFMVMEFVEGERLSAILGRGKVAPERALELVAQLLLALQHAHAQGVVHRDVKPDNAILTNTGLKLLDFGLAKLRDAPAGETPLTREGMVFGTPRYMSPEQVTAETVDARSDLYAVGVILYELLAGRPLFTGETVVEIMSKQVSHVPPPLDLPKTPGIDVEHLQKVVFRALAKMPNDRYSDAAAFVRALEECRIGATKPLVPAEGGGLAAAMASPAGQVQPIDATQLRSNTTSTTGIWQRRIRNRRVWASAAAVVVLGFGLRYLLETPAQKAERALAAGNLAEARPLVQALVEEQPKVPSVMLLSGHLAALEEDSQAAVQRYTEALEADPHLVTEPLLLRHLHALAKSNPNQAEALAIRMTQLAGNDAQEVLRELALSGHRPSVRRSAYEGLERINASKSLDRFDYLSGELTRNESDTCTIRRWYVERLVALEDTRALPILQRELDRRGGLFKTERTSACMQTLLSVAIKSLKE